jgi:hypothetical protein
MIIIGIVFRVVFYYLLPIFRITSATSSQLRRMQEQMKEMERKMNEPPPAAKKVKKDGDYIDYEELR